MSKKRKPRQTERQIQCDVVHFLRSHPQDILFCATVGGVPCSRVSRGRMVASGYEKGIPDLIIYEPRGGFHGLFIEFKSKTGRISPHQDQWLQRLSARGYYTSVQRDQGSAIQLISTYLWHTEFLYRHGPSAPVCSQGPPSSENHSEPKTPDQPDTPVISESCSSVDQ